MSILSLFVESLVNKWSTLPETVVDLTGRTVVITGSNVGLGFEAAKRFYAMNPARLIIAVRTVSKGEEAKRILLEQEKKPSPYGTVNNETKVEVWSVDLSSFESVKQFAKRCESELDRIDVFLANAAVQNVKWTTTKDGWESDLQTNVLSTFLLAALVAPILSKTAQLPAPSGSTLKPHLVIVASDTHYFAPLRAYTAPSILAAMNDEAQYIQGDRYPDTKAMDIVLTKQLTKNPILKDVIVCSVNPGFCRSELLRDMSSIARGLLYGLFARTTLEGSKTYMWASLSNDIPSGAYTSSCQVTRTKGVISGKDSEKISLQLWKEVADVLVKQAPQTETIWKF